MNKTDTQATNVGTDLMSQIIEGPNSLYKKVILRLGDLDLGVSVTVEDLKKAREDHPEAWKATIEQSPEMFRLRDDRENECRTYLSQETLEVVSACHHLRKFSELPDWSELMTQVVHFLACAEGNSSPVTPEECERLESILAKSRLDQVIKKNAEAVAVLNKHDLIFKAPDSLTTKKGGAPGLYLSKVVKEVFEKKYEKYADTTNERKQEVYDLVRSLLINVTSDLFDTAWESLRRSTKRA